MSRSRPHHLVERSQHAGRRARASACCLGVLAACAAGVAPAPAAGAGAGLPAVAVDVTTVGLADVGAHRGVTVSAGCAGSSRLVGGGAYLRRASDPAVLPTNGLVLGGTTASTGAAPVDLAATDGTVDPASWLSLANYTGVSEAGNQASTFALCATDGPAHTIVKTASFTGTVATQEASAPNTATATCPTGSRLIGGGAATSTPDQVNDGVTVGNNGNLKPLGNYPSDATGQAATDGSTSATSWSAFGSAGITTAQDTVTAYALCSTDPATPAIHVARADVDGPDAQPGTTVTTASASCPPQTRMLGGGYRVTETVAGTGSELQPQQGYHMRGSYPSTAAGAPPTAIADDATDPTTWTALQQAGGQNLGAGKHMTTNAYALCATEAPADSADVSIALSDDPDPVTVGAPLTYTLTVANAGPAPATGVTVTHTLPAGVSFASASTGACAHAAGTVTCGLGTLPSGAGETLTIGATVTAQGTLSSTASVTSETADPDAADNAAAQETTAVAVSRTQPTLSAYTPPHATLGAPIADTATLAGGASPTGTITFELFAPADTGCATPIASSAATVTGNGAYDSAPHTTAATGTYRWTARYDGDAGNAPVATACADAGQVVTVKAAPALTTQASAGTTAGGAITATARLTGGSMLTGSLAFRLYGPGDDACATPLRTTAIAVSGDGLYGAPAYTTTAAGTYRWVADYGGDANNRAAGPTACTAPDAAVAVAAVEALAPLAPVPAPSPTPAGPPSRPTPATAKPSSAFTIRGARADSRRRLVLTLRSSAAGRFTAVATARRGRTTLRFGSASARRASAGAGAKAITLRIAPGVRARGQLRRRSLVVRVVITFRPTGGQARTRSLTRVVKRRAVR